MPNPTPQLPSEFYKPSTLFTLGGSAGAVWLICLVMGSFDPSNDYLTPFVFRIVAIFISMAISILMFYRKKPTTVKVENYLLILLNGLLIFVNASGFNAISSKIAFENPDTIQSSATMGLFDSQVFWWENEEKFIYYRELRDRNQQLSTSLQACEQRQPRPDTDTAIDQATLDRLNRLNERLAATNKECQQQLAALETALEECRQSKTSDDANQAYIDNLKAKNERLQAMYEQCQQQLEELRSTLEKCRRSASAECDSARANDQATIDRLNSEINRLRGDLKKCTADLRKLNNTNIGPAFKEIAEVLIALPTDLVNPRFQVIQDTRWIHMTAMNPVPNGIIKRVTVNNTDVSYGEVRMYGSGLREVYIKLGIPRGIIKEGKNSVTVEADRTYTKTFNVIN